MERTQQLAVGAIVVGVLAALLALLADSIGIGGQEETFGWKQVVLLVAGIALALGGIAALLAGRGASREIRR